MIHASRARNASSFTVIKGALIAETYTVLARWDFARTKKQNLDALLHENYVGAASAAWLGEIAKVISRRLDPAAKDRPLTILAQRGCDMEIWKPVMLWHITRDEFLLRDFLIHCLLPAREEGVYRVRPEDLRGYIRKIKMRGAVTQGPWSTATQKRVAVGLLRSAADFGLMAGTVSKEFTSYSLPEPSFLYIMHALRDATASPARVLHSKEWGIYLMRPHEVEREVLRLHQFKKLRYEVAGSLVQLQLPSASALEYAETMVA